MSTPKLMQVRVCKQAGVWQLGRGKASDVANALVRTHLLFADLKLPLIKTGHVCNSSQGKKAGTTNGNLYIFKDTQRLTSGLTKSLKE